MQKLSLLKTDTPTNEAKYYNEAPVEATAMSRMHMIYDDRPLDQETVETTKWKEKWAPAQFQR